MALPVLNKLPKYDVTIPSTKKKTTFRPYLVKEEKVLLMASETGDENTIARATVDMIKSCVDDDIDEKNITIFDMEYLFCQIRSKSVGETSKMMMTCPSIECGHSTEVNIPLDQVKVTMNDDIKNIIKLNDEVSIEMRYPSFHSINSNQHLATAENETDIVYHTILCCIKAILTEEEKINIDDEPYDDLITFVNNMTTSQFNMLKDFVAASPEVELDFKWTCEGCRKEHEIELRGLQDFF